MMSAGQRSMMRSVLTALAVALLAGLFSASAMAQCVMCRASIGSNSVFARHLNTGILVLLVPPVSIFCTIFVLAYRHRKSL
jgi:hypothetical protein